MICLTTLAKKVLNLGAIHLTCLAMEILFPILVVILVVIQGLLIQSHYDKVFTVLWQNEAEQKKFLALLVLQDRRHCVLFATGFLPQQLENS